MIFWHCMYFKATVFQLFTSVASFALYSTFVHLFVLLLLMYNMKLIQTHLSLSFSMYAWRANNKLYFWRCNTNMNVEIATLIKHKMNTERLLFLRNLDTSTIVVRSFLVRMMIWVVRIDHFIYILVRKNLVGTVYM